jgi:acylphosphatase
MDMETYCRAKIKVIGQVQGVGYRFSTLRMATSLRLTGYVKNLPDDSVCIEAQGAPDSVRDLIEWCKTGPRGAFVESVEYSWLPVTDFNNFQIR